MGVWGCGGVSFRTVMKFRDLVVNNRNQAKKSAIRLKKDFGYNLRSRSVLHVPSHRPAHTVLVESQFKQGRTHLSSPLVQTSLFEYHRHLHLGQLATTKTQLATRPQSDDRAHPLRGGHQADL
jgi:hypothetical protein